ncbi:helix-turn-helix domain-containing protein [Holdemania massiliensis]|uniref:helix-turn-helix domain-containing protein n=1 Tax=Holdemania massiliensis TaxID=1468449 RepID=UPI00242A840D|nr:helix-turn-helix transcriptional regulator [Holdemania massiliensis]
MENKSQIGDRVKMIRESLKMSQEEFGGKIGITRASISNIEKGLRNMSDQTLKSICREFNVDFFWLRDGLGEMFMEAPETIVDELADEYKLSEVGKALVKFYVNLDPGLRDLFEAELQKTFQIKK